MGVRWLSLWLQNEKGLVVRSKEAQYLKEYRDYILQVGKQLAPLQVNHGGNILLVQIENEYGSYGEDKEYLDINRKLFIEAGFDGLLYTCVPAGDVGKGHLPACYQQSTASTTLQEQNSLCRKITAAKGLIISPNGTLPGSTGGGHSTIRRRHGP